jgi:hypothetical protein
LRLTENPGYVSDSSLPVVVLWCHFSWQPAAETRSSPASPAAVAHVATPVAAAFALPVSQKPVSFSS